MDKTALWQQNTVDRMRSQGYNVLWLKLVAGRWKAQVIYDIQPDRIKSHYLDVSRWLKCQ